MPALQLDTTRPDWRMIAKVQKPCGGCGVRILLAEVPGTDGLKPYDYDDGKAHHCTGQTGFHLPTNGRYPD